MTTLIGVYDDKGRCVGTCDARCYNARKQNGKKAVLCLCICNGRNHGVGLERASTTVSADDLSLFATVNEFKCEDLTVIDRTRVSGLKRARSIAEHEIWMRRHQLSLPFEG